MPVSVAGKKNETMVTYQKWTSIAFDVAKEKGMEPSRENSASVISVGAEVWNEQKDHLSTATVTEARTVARREINVS